MHHGKFLHPRLAALYDVDCPWGQDDDFFASVVAETPGAARPRPAIWTEVTAVRDSLVSFTHHYVFPDEELVSHATLRFRSEQELRTSLAAAGFTVEHLYGGWQRQPVGAGATASSW